MNELTSEVRPLHQSEAVKLIARAFFICLLVIPVTLNLPKVIHYAHATDWSRVEDCDADGKDDVTGEAVPWPGFDGTRGDTPDGPGTAPWWIAQNAGSGASSSGSTKSSSSGSTDSGTDSSSGSTTAKSSAVKKATPTATTSTKATPAAAQPAATAAAPAVVAPVTASSVTATAPVSVTSTASAESSATTASSLPVAAGTTGKGGPAAGSSSLWDALTVGFTSQNNELFAGLGLLAALALAGGLALGVGALRDIASYARLHRSESAPIEEPVTSTS